MYIVYFPPRLMKCSRCGMIYLVKFGGCTDPFSTLVPIPVLTFLKILKIFIRGKLGIPHIDREGKDTEELSKKEDKPFSFFNLNCPLCSSPLKEVFKGKGSC